MRLQRFLALTALIAGAHGSLACSDDSQPGRAADAGRSDAGKSPVDASKSAVIDSGGSERDANSPSPSDTEMGPQMPRDSGEGAHPDVSGSSRDAFAPLPLDAAAGDSATDASCASSNAVCGADLTIAGATLSPDGFRTVEVPDSSCEVQEGCYAGAGKRTVIPFELTVSVG